MAPSATLKDPASCTNHELMLVLIPDIEERIMALKKDHPEHWKELWDRVAHREGGFKPFDYWNGPD